MKLKVRKPNLNEKYACSTKDVKSIFGNQNENVYVSFGFLSINFSFDSTDHTSNIAKPKIDGTIIASASVNKRDHIGFEGAYYISFYVIKDLMYDKEKEKMFVELYLPLLYNWYQEMLVRPETSLSGVENFLVEWRHQDFKTHYYRYH